MLGPAAWQQTALNFSRKTVAYILLRLGLRSHRPECACKPPGSLCFVSPRLTGVHRSLLAVDRHPNLALVLQGVLWLLLVRILFVPYRLYIYILRWCEAPHTTLLELVSTWDRSCLVMMCLSATNQSRRSAGVWLQREPGSFRGHSVVW